MDIDFSVERTLVVDNVHDVRDIEASCGYISANKDGTVAMAVDNILSFFFAKLYGFVFDLLNGSLKSIKTLQTLLLLHLTVKGMVLDFQEVEDARYSLSTSD
jgi:hypothetical protein